jgi:hypothetical protein
MAPYPVFTLQRFFQSAVGKFVQPGFFSTCTIIPKRSAGSVYSERLFTVMARLTWFMSAAKPENQAQGVACEAVGDK